MKHKIIYIVLVIICMYFPAASRKCVAVVAASKINSDLRLAEHPEDTVSNLPVSVFSKLIINM
ncbi:MAG: hypothetical protein ABIU63_03100 [Chitinophagaceae bacterium]